MGRYEELFENCEVCGGHGNIEEVSPTSGITFYTDCAYCDGKGELPVDWVFIPFEDDKVPNDVDNLGIF